MSVRARLARIAVELATLDRKQDLDVDWVLRTRAGSDAVGLDQVAGVGVDSEDFYVKFKIRDLVDLAQEYPTSQLEVGELLPLLEGREEEEAQTDDRVEAAELKYPIIVVENDEGEIFAILDGTHRLQKAERLELETIEGYVIPKGKMSRFETRKAANLTVPQMKLREMALHSDSFPMGHPAAGRVSDFNWSMNEKFLVSKIENPEDAMGGGIPVVVESAEEDGSFWVWYGDLDTDEKLVPAIVGFRLPMGRDFNPNVGKRS